MTHSRWTRALVSVLETPGPQDGAAASAAQITACKGSPAQSARPSSMNDERARVFGLEGQLRSYELRPKAVADSKPKAPLHSPAGDDPGRHDVPPRRQSLSQDPAGRGEDARANPSCRGVMRHALAPAATKGPLARGMPLRAPLGTLVDGPSLALGQTAGFETTRLRAITLAVVASPADADLSSAPRAIEPSTAVAHGAALPPRVLDCAADFGDKGVGLAADLAVAHAHEGRGLLPPALTSTGRHQHRP